MRRERSSRSLLSLVSHTLCGCSGKQPHPRARVASQNGYQGRPRTEADWYTFQKVPKQPQMEKGCWHLLSAQGHSSCLNACPMWNTASPLCLMLPWPEIMLKLTSLAYSPPETCVEVEHLPSYQCQGTVGVMGVHPFSKSQLPMAGVPLPSLWELRQAEEQEYVLQDDLDRMLQDRMLSSATDRQGMGWRQRSAAVNSLFLAGLLRREEQSWQSLNIYMDTVQLSVAYSCLTPCSWVLRNTIFSSVVAYWLKLLQVLWITEKGELWRGWPSKSSCRLHSCCVEQHTLGNCLLGRVARYGRSFGGAERDE